MKERIPDNSLARELLPKVIRAIEWTLDTNDPRDCVGPLLRASASAQETGEYILSQGGVNNLDRINAGEWSRCAKVLARAAVSIQKINEAARQKREKMGIPDWD